jgi:diguanylate cyclase (GGDEF)-like protein
MGPGQRRIADRCSGGASPARSDAGPVRAAEWLAEHRGPPPRCAVVGLYVGAAAVAAVELTWTSSSAVALLWAPMAVVGVAIGARLTATACMVLAVATGLASDRMAGVSTLELALDGLVRAAGLLTIALLTSWSVLGTVELARRSRTDASTGLLNRSGFLAAAERERERAMRNGTSLSLVYFDLDGLKAANDHHGHAHGDAAIAGFAQHLDRSRRIVDVAGRLGGDEFALLLPDTGARGVQQVLRRLYRAIDRDAACLPASAGAVTWAHPPSVPAMLRQADRLMYRSKQDGGRAWAMLDLAADGPGGTRPPRAPVAAAAAEPARPPLVAEPAHHGT